MKCCVLGLLILSPLSSYGSQGEGVGYKNIIKNYFSSRKPNTSSYYGAPRSLMIFSGFSLHGETQEEEQEIFSSRILGFSQRIKEFRTIADVNLRIELHSVQLETQRSLQVSFTPLFTLPDIRSGFPIYIGAGGGFGIFPRHILQKQPALSLNAQMFTGLRFIDIYKNFGLVTELNLKMHAPFHDMKLYMELIANVGFLFSF